MPPEILHAIADLCLELERSQSTVEVREVLYTAAEAFGAGFFLFAMRSGKSISPPVQIVLSNYPKRWQRFYDETGAMTYDPILLHALSARGPFRWDGLHKDPRQLALRQQSIDNGMVYGFTTPLRSADASVALMSFSGGRPIAPEPAQWERTALAAKMLVTATQEAVGRALRARAGARTDKREPLTVAERRCLELSAAAMTADDIAVEMRVKPRTVRYYLDRAAEKLGVASRREAVVKAVAEGLVELRKFPPLGFDTGTLHD